jgi:hypothetical protein
MHAAAHSEAIDYKELFGWGIASYARGFSRFSGFSGFCAVRSAWRAYEQLLAELVSGYGNLQLLDLGA